MTAIYLYLITAALFLLADALMLGRVIQPLFQSHLGDWLVEPIRYAPAAAFYLAYIAGLIWLVSWPAWREGAPLQALVNGAVVGAMAYGTYEFTNLATLTRWSWQQVLVDGLWGTALTGLSAWGGVVILRALS